MNDLLERVRKVLDENLDRHFVQNGRRYFDYISPDYKHQLSGKFVLIDGNKIEESVPGKDIIVTKKLDGEMRTIFFDGQHSTMYTTGGKEEKEEDFPCLKELSEKLKAKHIRTGAFAGELNIILPDCSRTRVTDVIHAAADKKLRGTLSLSPFDILFIDNEEWKADHYCQTYEKMRELFGDKNDGEGKLVQPVPMIQASSAVEVKKIYEKWVVKEHAEGLVVHTEQPVILKIKPQHTIDAVAVGYTTGEDGVRDILFATIDKGGLFRIFASGGNGLTADQRKILLTIFEENKVSSSFVYTDSRGIAFQLVKPEKVFEVTAIDFSSENCMHEANRNKLALFDDDKGWLLEKIGPGVSTYNLKIIRVRDDKKAVYEDIRTEQISDICPFCGDVKDEFCSRELPPSEILEKYVYKKQVAGNLYVKKFAIIKTNKEKTGKYAAYVLHYSDFSPRRKENLKKKIYVSCSYDQLREIMEDLIYREIDGKWVYV